MVLGQWQVRSSPREMADQAHRRADRTGLAGSACQLAGIEPLCRSFGGETANRLGVVEIGIMADMMAGMVALHSGPGAGNDADAAAIIAARIAADETMAGRQRNDRSAGTDAGAFAIGDCGMRPRRFLNGERPRLEPAGSGSAPSSPSTSGAPPR